MLFVREDAVEAAWAVVDPILANEAALHPYEPGSWGPREADRLALDVGGSHNPVIKGAQPMIPKPPKTTN
jgi:glucose-6-phosphate 1-dehydrogenase